MLTPLFRLSISRRARTCALLSCFLLALGCGSGGPGDETPGGDADPGATDGAPGTPDGAPGTPDADPSAPDADPSAPDASAPDAMVPPDCTPAGTQCSDCVDNDGDGRIDGFDPECTSALDNRENSFATGIPGDNIDPNWQDCFFDGNSGGGNDGCNIATCCLTNPTSPSCPPQPQNNSCTPSQMCIDTCLGATIPGCDCFGCCTICKDSNCYTVVTNPAVAPNCTYDVIDDPTKCPPCTQIQECSNPCDPANCILCPGQTEDDLPASCTGGSQCANGAQPCQTSSECGAGKYCSAGCCIPQIG